MNSSQHSHTRSTDCLREYTSGCLPHWGKEGHVRVRGVVEHELTWAYYRMRRHEKHPLRQAVGEFLPQDALAEKMRFGLGSQFQFWRDLRPPFTVSQVQRVDNGINMLVSIQDASGHPDGELYFITYECPIEYSAERLMDVNSEAGTFNNKIHGVAQVRIPNNYPQRRPVYIVSWGQPTLIPPGPDQHQLSAPEVGMLPLATELGVNPTSDRMTSCIKACRDVQHRMDDKRKQVKVPELQRLLLGPHASLPRLAKMEETWAMEQSNTDNGKGARPASTSLHGLATRVRSHRLFTPAVGFVSYNG